MLAKLWKKLLLTICIIACIYNVMNKLVSRKSLEVQLNSVIEQTTKVPNLFKKQESSEINKENANIEGSEDSEDETIVVIY